MRVENLRNPIQETKETEAIGLSVGGRLRFHKGTPSRYDDVKWRKQAMETLEEGPRGQLLFEVDWVGVEKGSGHTITRVQTYEVDENFEIIGLLNDQVLEEAQFGSGATGGKYYDGVGI